MAATVLIVDSEAGIRQLLRVALAEAGYEPKLASSHEEARRICLDGGIDLVLADVGLHMNGHDLARTVAEQSPHLRVLLMAGWDEGCEGCPFSPRCYTINKPFRLERLLAAVAQALA
jgi:DNA-binding NtrC family response regulator